MVVIVLRTSKEKNGTNKKNAKDTRLLSFDVEQRDGGDPLLIGNAQNGYFQIGLFSNRITRKCGEKGEDPAVFIRIARFRDWINRIVAGAKD